MGSRRTPSRARADRRVRRWEGASGLQPQFGEAEERDRVALADLGPFLRDLDQAVGLAHRGQDAGALALDPAGEQAAVRGGLEPAAQVLGAARRLAQAEAGREGDATGLGPR